MSVCLVVGILPQWNPKILGSSPALDEIYFWNIYDTLLGYAYTSCNFSQISWIYFRDFGTLIPNNCELLVCLSVC